MIHDKYNRLNETEKDCVDIALKSFMNECNFNKVKINNSDPIERVAEAMAICIVENRK